MEGDEESNEERKGENSDKPKDTREGEGRKELCVREERVVRRRRITHPRSLGLGGRLARRWNIYFFSRRGEEKRGE